MRGSAKHFLPGKYGPRPRHARAVFGDPTKKPGLTLARNSRPEKPIRCPPAGEWLVLAGKPQRQKIGAVPASPAGHSLLWEPPQDEPVMRRRQPIVSAAR